MNILYNYLIFNMKLFCYKPDYFSSEDKREEIT